MDKKFYITTPLYYTSGKLHLGHGYTTVICDAIARFKRMDGYDVFYLTGTDEHGQKIADCAQQNNKTEKQYVDELVNQIKDLWSLLDISYDKFIRTTDDYHKQSVQKIFKYLLDKGDIYKGNYSGKYCKPCESFFTLSQLNDNKCPDCGRDVIDAKEECYFFKLSKYAQQIQDLLTKTDFLTPKFRVNEMVNNFIKDGLNDLAVSRSSVKWGISVPNDPNHVIYVWIDALSNYINALGYNNGNKNMDFWPADVHMVGKEIVRFHAIIWPALLMALDLPLPKKVFGHGWITFSGDKMSKSKGNSLDPYYLVSKYGVDALRYYLLREIPLGSDGAFSLESYLTRANTDLVNNLGNLVKRTIAMSIQYFKGVVNKPNIDNNNDNNDNNELVTAINQVYKNVKSAYDVYDTPLASEHIFNMLNVANKYIDKTTPWIKYKNNQTHELQTILYNLLEAVRVGCTLLLPAIPQGAKRIFNMLNLPVPKDFSNCFYGAINSYNNLNEEILYNRIDIKKELSQEEVKEVKEEKEEDYISIEDFSKCKLAVAKVIDAEKIEKTDKLLKLTLDLDGQKREVVSGIAKHYTTDELKGKLVVIIKNLKPVKLRGILSYGMVLCATDQDRVVLIEPSQIVKSGSEIG